MNTRRARDGSILSISELNHRLFIRCVKNLYKSVNIFYNMYPQNGCSLQDQALPLSRAPPSSAEGGKSCSEHPSCCSKHCIEYTSPMSVCTNSVHKKTF